MALEQHQEEPQDAAQRIESQMHQAEGELHAGHEKEAQDLLWKALASASNLKDPKIATRILELLSEKGTQH